MWYEYIHWDSCMMQHLKDRMINNCWKTNWVACGLIIHFALINCSICLKTMLQIMLTRFEVWSTMILLVSHHWFMCHPINIWRHILLGWWILWNLLVRIPQSWLNKCDSSQEQPVLFEDVVRTVGVRFQSFCQNSCLIMWNINENQFQWKSKRTYGSHAHFENNPH